MTRNVLHLEFATKDTFSAADGSAVSYQDIFEGIITNALVAAAQRGKKLTESEIEDLKDMAQEAALKAVMYHKSFDPEKGKRPQEWGNRIAENCKRDSWEDARRRESRVTTFEWTNEDGDELMPLFIQGYRGDEFEADASLRLEEMESEVREGMAPLCENYRKVLELNLVKGLSSSEIAKKLGISEGVAYTRLSKAKAALRRRLGQDFRLCA